MPPQNQIFLSDFCKRSIEANASERLGVIVVLDIERTPNTFERLPKRSIVERTFGWLNRFRRLSKDYDIYSEVSEAMIYSSLIRLMLKRLAT